MAEAEFKGTPGPWAWGPGYAPGNSTGDLFGIGGRQVIARANYENMWFAAYDREVDAANAHLIAAAPELLAACQSAIPKNVATDNRNIPDDQIIPLDFTMGELRRIQAAIAKALGSAA